MKVLVLSNDPDLKNLITNEIEWKDDLSFVFKSESTPIEVLSIVCQVRPSLLVFDDDMVKPNSPQVIRNVKKLHENISLIFITSDPGLEIGRSISQLGVQKYSLKPMEKEEFKESLLSIMTMTEKRAF